MRPEVFFIDFFIGAVFFGEIVLLITVFLVTSQLPHPV